MSVLTIDSAEKRQYPIAALCRGGDPASEALFAPRDRLMTWQLSPTGRSLAASIGTALLAPYQHCPLRLMHKFLQLGARGLGQTFFLVL